MVSYPIIQVKYGRGKKVKKQAAYCGTIRKSSMKGWLWVTFAQGVLERETERQYCMQRRGCSAVLEAAMRKAMHGTKENTWRRAPSCGVWGCTDSKNVSPETPIVQKENLQTSSSRISYSKQQNIHVFPRDIARNFPAREQKLTMSHEEDWFKVSCL